MWLGGKENRVEVGPWSQDGMAFLLFAFPSDDIAGRSGGSPRVQHILLRRRRTIKGEHGSVLAAFPTHARFKQSELERMTSQPSQFN